MSRHRRHAEVPPAGYWTSTQSYVLATIALVVGLVVGYFVRGSGGTPSTGGASAIASGTTASEPVTAPKPGPEVVNKIVEPLLLQLKSRPEDPALLTQIGNTYYDHKDYPTAIDYYEKSLTIKPDDVDVRTDMGTAIWYTGDAGRALKEYERSLSYRANHPNTLFNMGIVKWHGKNDKQGALEAWNRLLSTNPNYPDRERVQQLVQQLKTGGA